MFVYPSEENMVYYSSWINRWWHLNNSFVESSQILRFDRLLALVLNLFTRKDPLHSFDHHQVSIDRLRTPENDVVKHLGQVTLEFKSTLINKGSYLIKVR